jgi:hypothetical protein
MKNAVIAVLIVVAIIGIGFGIYQQINSLKIELKQKTVVSDLTKEYEAKQTELANKYETEIKNLSKLNVELSQKYEAEVTKIKETLAQSAENNTKSIDDRNKNILSVIRILQSIADIYTDKIIGTDQASFIVRNNRANYKNYSSKVSDTKIELDKCLEENKETIPDEAKELILKAMDCYKDALLIWDTEFKNGPDLKENKQGAKQEAERDTQNRLIWEKMRKINESAFYGNKYPALSAPPYSIIVPEGYILVPLKAVTAVWAQASQYIAEAGAILNSSIK